MTRLSVSARFGGRWLAALSAMLISALALVALGLALSLGGFLGNIVAESAGVLVSVVGAVLVAERLIEYRRRQEWANVRSLTLGAIAAHLCDIGSYLWVHFQLSDYDALQAIFQRRSVPDRAVSKRFEHLVELLRRLPDDWSRQYSTSDVAVDFYQAAEWDLHQIQTVLTPRVILSSGDRTLIDTLVAFDDVRRELHDSIRAQQEAVTDSAFPCVLSLAEACRRLYETLCDSWEAA
jgi:hypothetical protein